MQLSWWGIGVSAFFVYWYLANILCVVIFMFLMCSIIFLCVVIFIFINFVHYHLMYIYLEVCTDLICLIWSVFFDVHFAWKYKSHPYLFLLMHSRIIFHLFTFNIVFFFLFLVTAVCLLQVVYPLIFFLDPVWECVSFGWEVKIIYTEIFC